MYRILYQPNLLQCFVPGAEDAQSGQLGACPTTSRLTGIPKKGEIVILEDADTVKHYFSVLAIRAGEKVELLYRRGIVLLCRVGNVQKKKVELVVEEIDIEERAQDNAPHITLFQCVPKGQKLELIVQKATELGVSEIVLVHSARCIGKADDEKKRDRLQKIAAEAAMQSKRREIPYVRESIGIDKVAHTHLAILDEEEKERTLKRWLKERKASEGRVRIGILAGPEGGLERGEIEHLHGTSVTLGNRILRAETASMYALSVINYELESEKSGDYDAGM